TNSPQFWRLSCTYELNPLVNDDVTGCFINITVEDLGIEFDRVAIINLDEGDIILDGEISKGKLLNRIIGLFEIGKINENLDVEHKFIPEHFFYTGEFYRNGKRAKDASDKDVKNAGVKDLKDAIKHFLTKLANNRNKEEKDLYREEQLQNKHLDLCPVTRSIIRRIKADK
ncbi:MAG: hypothetical protein H8D56_18370, partial [Planctomycetes bacterium]|nr:hypothetical protein [Planctomycetota bacterium]